MLQAMFQEFLADVQYINDQSNDELHDFHARRLVEIGGYIAVGYLLLFDAERDAIYARSARIWVQYAHGKVAEHHSVLRSITAEQLPLYRDLKNAECQCNG